MNQIRIRIQSDPSGLCKIEWNCFMHRLRSIRINVNQSKNSLRWPEPIEKARIKKRNADMHLLPEV